MNTGSEKAYFGNYTLEKIYDLVGRNDYVSTITFRPNTQSEKLYGNTLTIVFLYTQQEREELEDSIKKGVVGKHGYVRAKYLLFDLPDTKIKELEEVGVNSNDITNIEWLPYTEPRNTYGSKEKRHIDTITIESKPSCYENDILWMYGALKTYKEKGIGLCPEEQDNYLAYKLILEPAKLTEEENAVIYDANGKMNEDIAYVYLGYKCVTLNISSFLHIYLRHVEDLQIGSQYAHKDKFQLYEKDIETVISRVLHGINTDYQVYKSDHPTQRYGKYGKDSYYLLGDYYTIQVNEDGSIGTFHKNPLAMYRNRFST